MQLFVVVAAAMMSVAHGVQNIVEYDELKATFRCIVAVPSADDPDPKQAKRREKIMKMTEQHVAKQQESLVEMEWAYMSANHDEFTRFFPNHVAVAEGETRPAHVTSDEVLVTPGLRFMNLGTGDYMSPNWDILMHQYPDELQRLSKDFARWVLQTEGLSHDDDGVMILHAKNLAQATDEYENVLVNFYAPWCQYSQAMLPRIAETNKQLAKMSEKGLIPKIGVGNVNVDEEGELRDKHAITSYPTLKMVHDDEDGSIVSDNFEGDTDASGAIVSHVVSSVTGVTMLDSKKVASDFITMIETIDGLLGDKDDPVVVLGTYTAPSQVSTYTALSESIVGGVRFMAVTYDMALATSVLKGVSGDKKVKAKKDMVYVYTKTNGLLSLKLPSNDDEYLLRWVSAASVPTVERFNPGTKQGDRMRNGPIGTILMLIGAESHPDFNKWKGAIEEVGDKRRGEANFLFADENEPRIMGIVEAAQVKNFPAAILISMRGDFEPRTVEGKGEMSATNMNGLLDEALNAPLNPGGGDEF